ncbi:MAG TPA: hypothetical protein VK680_12545 [Solirubrobacteraceae bacterium]|nr:hypothetical protein [Solirubrobacteraceae bacterium]
MGVARRCASICSEALSLSAAVRARAIASSALNAMAPSAEATMMVNKTTP